MLREVERLTLKTKIAAPDLLGKPTPVAQDGLVILSTIENTGDLDRICSDAVSDNNSSSHWKYLDACAEVIAGNSQLRIGT